MSRTAILIRRCKKWVVENAESIKNIPVLCFTIICVVVIYFVVTHLTKATR